MRKIMICMIVFLLTACSSTSRNGVNPLATQGQGSNATGQTSDQAMTINPFAPQAGDSTLSRQEAYMDSASISSLTTSPIQYEISLQGNLPTPCNLLRVQVNNPDATGLIVIDVYSVVDPGKACAQVLEPFSVVVNLGSFSKGVYPVQVNGTQQGEISAP